MWNYRVVKHKDEATQEEYLEINEVYYDTLGKPMGYCNATVCGETLGEIESVLQMMSQALTKATLKFNKEPDENIKRDIL
jgi:hypothetical protein